MGNSPEMCRGLKAHGFSDLETSIHYHVSLTRMMYYEGDARKFLSGTPKEKWSVGRWNQHLNELLKIY